MVARPAERGDEEPPVFAAIAVCYCPLGLGAGPVDEEVVTVLSSEEEARADGDAEEDEVVLRAEDPGASRRMRWVSSQFSGR